MLVSYKKCCTTFFLLKYVCLCFRTDRNGVIQFHVQRLLSYTFLYRSRNGLRPELLMMNGSCLIEMVYGALNKEEMVFDAIAKFCEENVAVEVISSVVKYITHTYCQMRGKDFARKLMSKNTKSLQQT